MAAPLCDAGGTLTKYAAVRSRYLNLFGGLQASVAVSLTSEARCLLALVLIAGGDGVRLPASASQKPA